MTRDELEMMELLESISRKISDIKEMNRDIRQSLGRMEQHYATMSAAVDRMRGNVDQIKDRLDLHGEAA